MSTVATARVYGAGCRACRQDMEPAGLQHTAKGASAVDFRRPQRGRFNWSDGISGPSQRRLSNHPNMSSFETNVFSPPLSMRPRVYLFNARVRRSAQYKSGREWQMPSQRPQTVHFIGQKSRESTAGP